jgi:hypothetical protein
MQSEKFSFLYSQDISFAVTDGYTQMRSTSYPLWTNPLLTVFIRLGRIWQQFWGEARAERDRKEARKVDWQSVPRLLRRLRVGSIVRPSLPFLEDVNRARPSLTEYRKDSSDRRPSKARSKLCQDRSQPNNSVGIRCILWGGGAKSPPPSDPPAC